MNSLDFGVGREYQDISRKKVRVYRVVYRRQCCDRRRLTPTGVFRKVVDEFNNSTVWDDDHFKTDSSALTEAKKTILAEGVSSLVGPESGKGEWS